MAFQIAQYYSVLRISSFIGGIWGATTTYTCCGVRGPGRTRVFDARGRVAAERRTRLVRAGSGDEILTQLCRVGLQLLDRNLIGTEGKFAILRAMGLPDSFHAQRGAVI